MANVLAFKGPPSLGFPSAPTSPLVLVMVIFPGVLLSIPMPDPEANSFKLSATPSPSTATTWLAYPSRLVAGCIGVTSMPKLLRLSTSTSSKLTKPMVSPPPTMA